MAGTFSPETTFGPGLITALDRFLWLQDSRQYFYLTICFLSVCSCTALLTFCRYRFTARMFSGPLLDTEQDFLAPSSSARCEGCFYVHKKDSLPGLKFQLLSYNKF